MEGEFSDLALLHLLARPVLLCGFGLLSSVGLVVLFGVIAKRRARQGEAFPDNAEHSDCMHSREG